ncbi:MAG: DUF616 domain-containing protein [Gammaproteobacteria bacterium]|nr:DUF616 domain-containing protein [Gammaproteobacteria bacterium]
MARVVVYSANLGGYDTVQPTTVPGRFVLFTDGDAPPGWERFPVKPEDDPRRQARYYKLLPHLCYFAQEAQFSIWLDASTALKVPPEMVVREWLGDGFDIALFRHPARDCAYAEGRVCIHKGKDRPEVIQAQLDRYAASRFPEHFGLGETPILVRRNTQRVAQFCAAWWQEVKNGSLRDQLSFDFVRWQQGGRVGVNLVDGGEGWRKRKHPWFEFTPHVRREAG